MAFKRCRKCKYQFVPLDYSVCPKCNSKMSGSRGARFLLWGSILGVTAALLIFIAVELFPRITIAIK